MRGTYVASIRLDLHLEWMECIGRNLITRVLTSRDTYAKHNVVDRLSTAVNVARAS